MLKQRSQQCQGTCSSNIVETCSSIRPTVLAHHYFTDELDICTSWGSQKVYASIRTTVFPNNSILHPYAFHYTTTSRLGPSGFIQICSYNIATPPATTASPPTTDQSGTGRGPAAADLGEAVLAGLEVAVLLVERALEELVLETEAILEQGTLVATSLWVQSRRV